MTIARGDLRRFRGLLHLKEAELVQRLRKRDGIAIEKSPDQIDELQHAATLELALQSLNRGTNLLRNVRTALRRIQDGTYGTCIECEWAISPRRLAAVPWALLCVECQEAADGVDGSSHAPASVGEESNLWRNASKESSIGLGSRE